MVPLIQFVAALLIMMFVLRLTTAALGVLFGTRTAVVTSFLILGGLTALAMAVRILPIRVGLTFVIAPLMLWTLINFARAKMRRCPFCRRYIAADSITCPKCRHDLDTGATLHTD